MLDRSGEVLAGTVEDCSLPLQRSSRQSERASCRPSRGEMCAPRRAWFREACEL